MCLYFFTPQVIGIILLIFICVGLIVYVIRESCQQEVEMEDADVAELTVLRMSSLRTRTSWDDSHRPPHPPCWNRHYVNILKGLCKTAVSACCLKKIFPQSGSRVCLQRGYNGLSVFISVSSVLWARLSLFGFTYPSRPAECLVQICFTAMTRAGPCSLQQPLSIDQKSNAQNHWLELDFYCTHTQLCMQYFLKESSSALSHKKRNDQKYWSHQSPQQRACFVCFLWFSCGFVLAKLT